MRISAHESDLLARGKDTKHLSSREEGFVLQRGGSRDSLIEELARYRVYASDDEAALIDDFLK